MGKVQDMRARELKEKELAKEQTKEYIIDKKKTIKHKPKKFDTSKLTYISEGDDDSKENTDTK